MTGLAYGAQIMPVRVLDRNGEGDSVSIAKGIRWAAKHGADVINLSFEFGEAVRARQIPNILDALRFADRKGVLVVGAAGNEAARAVAYPARAQRRPLRRRHDRARLRRRVLQHRAAARPRRPGRRARRRRRATTRTADRSTSPGATSSR